MITAGSQVLLMSTQQVLHPENPNLSNKATRDNLSNGKGRAGGVVAVNVMLACHLCLPGLSRHACVTTTQLDVNSVLPQTAWFFKQHRLPAS